MAAASRQRADSGFKRHQMLFARKLPRLPGDRIVKGNFRGQELQRFLEVVKWLFSKQIRVEPIINNRNAQSRHMNT